jgi:hypothetical protein
MLYTVKMALVNNVCYKQRIVIEFLDAEKETVVNIHKRLYAVYKCCAVDRSTVSSRVQKIKATENGYMELYDLPRSGRSALATRTDKLNRADAIICKDRHITSQQLALQLSVSKESAMTIF